MKKMSLIVPCYNEEQALPYFYDAAGNVMGEMPDLEFEILFIDDGSKDGTLTYLKEIAQKDKRVKYISFSKNFGKEAAMYAGFCNASGDYVAVLDADMQDPPSLLPEMYQAITEEGYDSAATRRFTREGEPPVRSMFARLFYKLINRISDAEIVDGARDFRLMKREMVDSIMDICEYNRFTKGIYGWIGYNTKWIPFENVERVAGETKWSFWKLFKYAIEGVINFSETPLHIASFCGMGFCGISLFSIIFIIIRRLAFGDPVAGWASMICVILLVAGVELLCLGIMGEYLAKTYLEVKKRPHFIIRDTNKEDAVIRK